MDDCDGLKSCGPVTCGKTFLSTKRSNSRELRNISRKASKETVLAGSAISRVVRCGMGDQSQVKSARDNLMLEILRPPGHGEGSNTVDNIALVQ